MGNQSTKADPRRGANGGGVGKKTVHWKTAGVPLPPGRPELVTGHPNTARDVVTIKWGRPVSDGGAVIIGYIVEHRRIGSQQWQRAVNMLIPHNELTINGLDPGWRYHFRVIAQNAIGPSYPSELSEPLTVLLQRNVSIAPNFTSELHDTAALEGTEMSFRVSYLGSPHPDVTWFKDGFELLNGRRISIVTTDCLSTLRIEDLEVMDEGEIKCAATNRIGSASISSMLTIMIPPKVILSRGYSDGLIIEAEEIIRLKVSIEGRPQPEVLWYHDGEIVPNGGRFEILTTTTSSALKILNSRRSDRGEYFVKATNKQGEDSASFLMTIVSRPAPPGKTMITRSFAGTVSLAWSPPLDDGGCKIGNYIIEYFRLGWDVWLKASTSRQLTCVLNDLIEGSEYKFRVKAENPYGVSDPGEESHVIFLPDAKRGILKPVRDNSLEHMLGIPKQEEPTRPKSPVQLREKPKHTIKVQFAGNIYTDSPSRASSTSSDFSGFQEFLASEPTTPTAIAPPPVIVEPPKPTPPPTLNKAPTLKAMKNMENLAMEMSTSLDVPNSSTDVHSSNEFMIVLCPEKGVKNEKDDNFDFEVENFLAPPPLSLSMPDLRADFPPTPGLRHAVSSTELIYERAMTRFYNAVAYEEAEKSRQSTLEPDSRKSSLTSAVDRRKSLPEGKDQNIVRVRLNSLQEERRHSLRRRLSSEDPEVLIANLHKKQKEEKLEAPKATPETISLTSQSSFEQEKVSISSHEEYTSDYSESTASSSEDSIVEKMAALKERLSRIDSDGEGGNENKTYQPPRTLSPPPRPMGRSISPTQRRPLQCPTSPPMSPERPLSPYRQPEPGMAVISLNQPLTPPDPNFVPKSILKRPSKEFSPPPQPQPQPQPLPMQGEKTPPNRSPLMKPKKEKKSLIGGLFGKVKLAPSGSSSKEQLNKVSAAPEVRQRVVLPLENAVSPSPPVVASPVLEQRPRAKLEKRQSSLEENKVIIDHYDDVVRHRDEISRVRNKIPLYMNPDLVKKIEEKAKQQGEIIDSDEEQKNTNPQPSANYGSLDRNLSPTRRVKETANYGSLGRTLSPNHLVKEKPQTKPPVNYEPLERAMSPTRRAGRRISFEEPTEELASLQRARSPPSRRPMSPNNERKDSLPRRMLSPPPLDRYDTSTDDSLPPDPTARAKSPPVLSSRLQEEFPSEGLERARSPQPTLSRRRLPSGERSRRTSEESLPRRTPPGSRRPSKDLSSTPSPRPTGTVPKSQNRFSPARRIGVDSPPTPRVLRHKIGNGAIESRSPSPGRRSKTPEQLDAELRVRSQLSDTTDSLLLLFSIYIYFFGRAVFCVPILVLILYRRLGNLVRDFFSPGSSSRGRRDD